MRFYGGSPAMWAFELPWEIVEAHIEAMPAIEAHESLVASTRVALGSGVLKPTQAQSLQRKWDRQARQSSQRRRLLREGFVAAPPQKGGTK